MRSIGIVNEGCSWGRLIRFFCLFSSGFIHTAKPTFLIQALQKAPTLLYAGQTANARYQITNNTPYVLQHNGLVNLPPGITQSGGTCLPLFSLNPGQSCTVTLLIVANSLPKEVHGGPEVCNTPAHPVYCSSPTTAEQLSVINNNSPPPLTQPSAPTNVQVVAGDAQATIFWQAPLSDGGCNNHATIIGACGGWTGTSNFLDP